MASIQQMIDSFLYSVQEYNKDNAATLTRIIDQLEEIAKHSHSIDYLSLNNLTLLIQDNLLSIYKEHQTLSDEEHDLLKQWPKLLDDYINNKSLDETIDSLVNNLSNETWPMPLQEQDSGIVKELLLTTILEKQDTTNFVSDEELSTTLTTLANTASRVVGNNSAPLNNFSEQIRDLSTSAQKSGFNGFYDLCLMALDNISQLDENNTSPTDTQMLLISSWLGLAKKHLGNPESQEHVHALIKNLSDEHWPIPIAEADKVILLDILGIEKPEENEFQDKPELTFTQILTKTKTLVLISNETDSRIEEINQSLQSLIDISSSKNLLGLQDVCLLYQEALHEYLEQAVQVTDDELKFLSLCPDLIQKYYTNSGSPETISALIQYLQNPRWVTPLGVEDAELLKNMLADYNENSGVYTFHGNLLAAAIEQNNQTSNIEIPPAESNDHSFAINQELVEMLLSEMFSISDELDDIIPSVELSVESNKESISRYSLRMERFGNACQAAELTGLYQACSILIENLTHLINSSEPVINAYPELFKNWIMAITEYLTNLGGQKSSVGLSEVLKSEHWAEPISDELATTLIDLLIRPYSSSKQTDVIDRQTEASIDDVTIEITDDINKDLLDGLLQELPDQTSGLSECIQNLCSNKPDITVLDKAQRIAHTIKGAANTVGIRGLAILTHQLEDILQVLSQNEVLPSSDLADTLMSATDCLEDMTEALMENRSSPSYAQTVLQNVLDWANLLDKEGIDVLNSEHDITNAYRSLHGASVSIAKADEQIESDKSSQPVSTITIPTQTIDNLLRLMGESMILNLQLNEKITHSSEQTSSLKEHNNSIRDLTNELERHIEMSGTSFSQKKVVNQSEVFDPLELEEYNELHTTSNRIVESASDAHEINSDIENELSLFNELLFSQSNIQQEIYDLIMRTRMVPITAIIPRLERSIRQTCRSSKKQARLVTLGQDTLIDSNILNKIIDPLMHMIRNSIDHGIESPEQRATKNKDATGTIKLIFTRQGTQIIINFEDDGAGLNNERILEVAKQKGIVSDDESLSNDKLQRLILQPGFTTSKNTTLTSGRGIGMDVVYAQVLSLNGRLQINSTIDKGVKFELILPLSLMTSHAVFIHHDKQLIAISNYNIIRILHPTDGELINHEGQQKIKLDDEILSFDTIEYLLNTSSDNTIEANHQRPALLVSYENSNHVVFIENIIDSRNIVIKSMGAYLKRIRGIVGATIVGDGSVVPVIDLSDLIRTSQNSKTHSIISLAHTNIIKLLPTVMIIDDSISTRRALSQVMKDAGYDIATAKDGIEAIGLIEKKIPSIILVDFEMPRMNGIELTSHVRGMNDLKDIPIIMITSRTTDKHKELAFNAGVNKYMIKPFSEDALLDDVAELINKRV